MIGSIVFAGVFLCCFASALPRQTVDINYGRDEDPSSPRNLIMMIPDGTSPNIFTMARGVLDPTMEKILHIDPLLKGTVQTYSNTSLVTDSAASATAYSTGVKTYDGAIAVDMDRKPLGTILEAAKARGMVVGMIATSRVTHATPACFASHVDLRVMERDIAQQYVAGGKLDFLLGGGKKFFMDEDFTKLKSKGYDLVWDKDGLSDYVKKNSASGKLKLFGLFSKSHMAYEVDRSLTKEPSLSEMVDGILTILKNNEQAKKNGYFIMIEGSRIDHAGHGNDPGTMAKEAIQFDEAVGVVKKHISDFKNTGLVSVADHGTGGVTLGQIKSSNSWSPEKLNQQVMSTEWMSDILEKLYDDSKGKSNINEIVMKKVMSLLASHAQVDTSEISAQRIANLKKYIAIKSLNGLSKVMGRIIGDNAFVGFTTGGHVGGDVNLYCLGPWALEKQCRGVHENTYVNYIMRRFLHLKLQKQTLKLRGD